MTVSAFCSVSLAPPQILICADLEAITHGIIQESRVFSVSLLGQDQGELSNRFASKKHEHRRFEGLECEDGVTGCPRIPGAIAWLDCKVSQELLAGDHVIYVADVMWAAAQPERPLLYFRGAYRELDSQQ